MSQLAIKPPISIAAFHVKVLAALLMVIDHLGVVFDVDVLRIMGRFSFPLFAWLLSQGAKHTQNWPLYQRRLLILAIASQPVHALFRQSILPLNAIFQLWLGLILIRLLQQQRMGIALWVSIFGVATLFVDYHYYGIGLVYLIYSYPFVLCHGHNSLHSIPSVTLWIAAFVVLHIFYSWTYPTQIYALPFIALMPLLNTVRVRGQKARWFYWFYPLHFFALIFWRSLL